MLTAGPFSAITIDILNILIIGLIPTNKAAAFAYIVMTLVSVCSVPDGFPNWQAYIEGLDGMKGIAAVPTFFAAKSVMGTAGLVIMSLTAVAVILTGIIGGYRATTRVLATMARNGSFRINSRIPPTASCLSWRCPFSFPCWEGTRWYGLST